MHWRAFFDTSYDLLPVATQMSVKLVFERIEVASIAFWNHGLKWRRTCLNTQRAILEIFFTGRRHSAANNHTCERHFNLPSHASMQHLATHPKKRNLARISRSQRQPLCETSLWLHIIYKYCFIHTPLESNHQNPGGPGHCSESGANHILGSPTYLIVCHWLSDHFSACLRSHKYNGHETMCWSLHMPKRLNSSINDECVLGK